MYHTPYITKQIGRSTKLIDIPTEMLSQRIIYLGTEINDYVANSIIQQMMWLATVSEDDIDLYIQSPGGSVYAGYSIKDCMDILAKKGIKVNTIGTGLVASMGAYLLSAGTGKRKATKNCRIMLHSVSSGTRGTIHDMTVDFEESKFLNDSLMVDISNFTKSKSTVEDIRKKCERDCYMSAEEAIKIGLIDEKI
jgi:ATP-dependent Clp protease protease subunit